MSNYQEKLDRTLAAVALEPVDHVPFSYLGTAVNCQFTNTLVSDYCRDMKLNYETNLEGVRKVGEVDSVQGILFNPYTLPAVWFSEVAVPGEELADNELWQLHEKELIQQSDYDEILEGGYEPWYAKFLKEKLGDPLERSRSYQEYLPIANERWDESGIPNIKGASFCSPFEMFCGGRSMISFMADDLMGIPDKVDAVFKKVHDANMVNFEKRLADGPHKPIGAWIGGWRGTPNMLPPDMFERFSWNYIMDLVDLLVSRDVIPILHLDSCWDRGIEYFKQLPKGKCIVALDGMTDIFMVKEAVGDRCCIMGDVPSQLLAMGTREETADYCSRLVREVGPTGFILCSGCDIPQNAKLENVQAMAQSVLR